MPDIFLLLHCVGTVLGKAQYSDYFVACQNVTVGSDKGYSPIISKGVYMGPGSAIIGRCLVAMYTHIGIKGVLHNQDTAEANLIVGSSPNILTKKLRRNLIEDVYFILESLVHDKK